MSSVLSKWMTVYLVLTIVFTPLFVYLDSLHREVVDTVLHQSLKEASIAGHYTPEIIQDIKDTLVDDYKFNEDDISIIATTVQKQRGEYIDITLSVPRGPIFILNMFNQGPERIERTARIMSEHIS